MTRDRSIVTAAMRVTRLCLVAAVCALVLPATGWAHHSITYGLVGTQGQNGWYRSNVTIQWSISNPGDITSTTGCEPGQLVTTEGTTTHTCSATATDHTVSLSVTIKIDKTLPSVPAGTAARGPDSSGWYNHAVGVSFTATDSVSGLDFCTGGSYGGPDSAAASVPGTCTDRAGNSSSGSFGLQYDASAPAATVSASRGPDAAGGWYNRALTVTFAQAPGDLSGPGSCRAPVEYSAPDSAAASVSGTCTDRAGNQSAAVALGFKYDATPPQATATPSRAPNGSGWYNAPLTIAFAQVPGDVSGQGGCSPQASYNGPDAASVSRSGTCTDGAGNRSANATFAFAYDASAPAQPTATAARAPESTGWYRSSLGVSFASSDVGPSGIATCNAPTYNGPDSAAAAVSGTCTDRAGNVSPAATLVFKYDATAPLTNATPSRAPNGNGWYNAPFAISFAQAPGDVSGTGSCTAATTYGGPDTASASRSGACTDGAGNPGAPASFGFKYDASAPGQPVATPGRGPDANGWYNRSLGISFAASDVGPSGIEACSSQTYTGPDTATASVSGTCADRAGNTSPAAVLGFKYDATPPSATVSPSRQANAEGWHNAPFDLSFVQAAGDVSGPGQCSAPLRYSGPDAASASRSGTCTDAAGNTSASATYTFAYDASPPSLPAATPARGPDVNGWYNREVGVSFAAPDVGPAGIASCSAFDYSGPDAPSAAVSGVCIDKAGNSSAPVAFVFKFDATPPATTAVPDRGDGGWYREPVTVTVAGADATSGIAACSGPAVYSGPDTAGTPLGGSCVDAAGNSSAASFTVRFDATPPAVSVGLSVGFNGADATSGIESCTAPVRYTGPDRTNGSVAGTCRDNAGNAAGAAHVFRYDATAPVLRRAAVKIVQGVARLTWQRSADSVSVTVVRTPGRGGARSTRVYAGRGTSFTDTTVRNGVRYRWEITTADDAGNVASAAVGATVRPALYLPAAGAVVLAPVQVAWEAVDGARFYNLQLLRDGAKILSTWPAKPRAVLRGSWTYAGRTYRLEPGVYVAWVWAARGTRAKPDYGRPLGSTRFVVKR